MNESAPQPEDLKTQIREFLVTRRGRLTPQQAGLPVIGTSKRRVKGLRREEVALLCGISVEYYTRLERGSATGVSDSILEHLARALHFDEAERAHLFQLMRRVGTTRSAPPRSAQPVVRAPVQRILDALTEAPAFVFNGPGDIIATNSLGRALYEPMYRQNPHRAPNNSRFIFLDPIAKGFWGNWNKIAADAAGILQAEAGRNPYDTELAELIGELSTRSKEFVDHWARRGVRIHSTGRKTIHHPVVGELDLPFESTPLIADPGHYLLIYTPEPNTPTAQSLKLLASWAATDHVSTPRQQANNETP